MKFSNRNTFWWVVVTMGAVGMGSVLALTHSKGAIVSFDEGFHGFAALTVWSFLRQLLHFLTPPAIGYQVFTHEAPNGILWYPPIWAILAGVLGVFLGPTIQVFRFATILFYIASLLFVYWFTGNSLTGNSRRAAALIATGVLGTVPLVAIYAHLMMLEVPMLCTVAAMVGTGYAWATGGIPRTWRNGVIVALIFTLGPLSKLAAIAVAWGTLIVYAVLSSLFFARQRVYRSWLKPEFILFLALSVLSLSAYIHFTEVHFGANMLDFHLQQSRSLSGGSSDPLTHALQTAQASWQFYLRDVRHMPYLGIIWLGSLLGYLLWKRTPFSLLLVSWSVTTYLIFSGVEPQVVQYILPIYVPLAISVGCFTAELAWHFWPRRASYAAFCIAGLVVLLQLYAMPHSEGYGWRTMVTGQEQMTSKLEAEAKPGDRIMTWHDSTTFLVRSAGMAKNLQIENASQQICSAAFQDSVEWAAVLSQPPGLSSLDQAALQQPNWQPVGHFGDDGTTILYHNQAAVWPLHLSAAALDAAHASKGVLRLTGDQTQPALWGCYRLLPLGELTAQVTIARVSIIPNLPDTQEAVRLEYASYPGGEESVHSISAAELRAAPALATFNLPVHRHILNLQGEFRIFVTGGVTIEVPGLMVTGDLRPS